MEATQGKLMGIKGLGIYRHFGEILQNGYGTVGFVQGNLDLFF